ncbi:MAG: nickel-dependent hydrogenase large subunit, partial [Candidatus Helarchaeota archaeon]
RLNYHGEKNLLAGQSARFNIAIDSFITDKIKDYLDNFNKPWKSSVIFSDFLQLLELFILIEEGILILEEENLTRNLNMPTLPTIKKTEGFGVVEAPRGTLIHHYEINDRLVLEKVELRIPTEINIPSINNILTRNCIKFYEQTKDLEKTKKLAQMILRCFDPCISCATH